MEDFAFIAPHDFSTFSFRPEGKGYVPDTDLSVPPVTKWVRHKRSIIFVSRADPAVHFLDLDSRKQWSLSLAWGSHPFDLAVWQDWLFVAAGGKALLATQSWEAATAWMSLPCEKEIDALAVHDGKLIAIDNMVTPKWLLSYELTPSGAMDPARVELPVHGTYEEIMAAAHWEGKFAVLSRTVGRAAVGKHVWLLSCASFEQLDHLYCHEASFDPRDDIGFLPLIDAKDIAAYRDVLVIAGDRHGLIATSLSSEPRTVSLSWPKDTGGLLYDDFRQFWPSPSRQRPIVSVQSCDAPAGFILTSLEETFEQDVEPWETAVAEHRVRTFSYFLSYEEVKHLLRSMPPGTVNGTPWRDTSNRAKLRRKAGKKGNKGKPR